MNNQLLKTLMDKNGMSNKEGVEKARLELAGAITRVVVNEALAEAKMRAKTRDEATGAKQPQ